MAVTVRYTTERPLHGVTLRREVKRSTEAKKVALGPKRRRTGVHWGNPSGLLKLRSGPVLVPHSSSGERRANCHECDRVGWVWLYEDDEDGGEVIIYSGHSGQDPGHLDKHSKQTADQKLEGRKLWINGLQVDLLEWKCKEWRVVSC